MGFIFDLGTRFFGMITAIVRGEEGLVAKQPYPLPLPVAVLIARNRIVAGTGPVPIAIFRLGNGGTE